MSINDTLSCQELVELVTDYLENALLPEMRKRFEEHVAAYPGCETYNRTDTTNHQQIAPNSEAASLSCDEAGMPLTPQQEGHMLLSLLSQKRELLLLRRSNELNTIRCSKPLQLRQIGWFSRRQGQGFRRLPHLLNKVLEP